MAVAPDLAGFKDAQDRLRGQLGTDVTFSVPTAASYDPAEPLDPETQRPFDPFADPTAGTGEPREEVVRATVATPRIAREGAVPLTPAGPTEDYELMLDIAIEDAPRIEGATHVTVFGEPYRVDETRPDGLTTPLRLIVYGTRA